MAFQIALTISPHFEKMHFTQILQGTQVLPRLRWPTLKPHLGSVLTPSGQILRAWIHCTGKSAKSSKMVVKNYLDCMFAVPAVPVRHLHRCKYLSSHLLLYTFIAARNKSASFSSIPASIGAIAFASGSNTLTKTVGA